MITRECKACRKETDHRLDVIDRETFEDYTITICQECGMRELVPDNELTDEPELKLELS